MDMTTNHPNHVHHHYSVTASGWVLRVDFVTAAPAGEDRAIRETCWARRVEVTETVTQGGKLNGVTETCMRHVETREIIEETAELIIETWEMGTVEGRLHDTDGVKDEHTHTRR